MFTGKKRNKKHKMGEWEERGGRKMKREGRGGERGRLLFYVSMFTPA